MKFTIWYALLAFAMRVNAQHVLEQGLSKLNITGGSLQTGKIELTGSGSPFGNKAVSGSYTTLDEIEQEYDISVTSANKDGNFQFGIGRQSNLAGTYIEFSGDASKSKILINRLDGSTLIFNTEYDLPFQLRLNTPYKIRMSKKIRFLIIEISNGPDHFVIDNLKFPSPFFGCQWGNPFVACSSGTISVSSYKLSTPLNLKPRLLVFGDSFIEGNSLDSEKLRYISYIQDSIRPENIVISGKGGENSTSIYTRFFVEKEWFKSSTYCLLAFGCNDLHFDAWKNNMILYTTALKKTGIIPIICTLTPRLDRKDFIAAANNWIRNSYDGAYVDISRAVSENDTDWIAGSALADNIHPTPESHKKIFYRIAEDAPYLFRDNRPFSIDFWNETTVEKISTTIQYAATSQFNPALSGKDEVIPLTPGTEVYFTTLMNPHSKNIYDLMIIPDRPAMPKKSLTSGASGTFDWIFTPGFDAFDDYEYSTDNGSNWGMCMEKPIHYPGLRLYVRIKATAKNFRSDALLLEKPDGIFEPSIPVVQAYPNPATNQLFVKDIHTLSLLHVFSSDGRLVYNTDLLPGDTRIDVNALRSGNYLFVITNTETSERKQIKILIEH